MLISPFSWNGLYEVNPNFIFVCDKCLQFKFTFVYKFIFTIKETHLNINVNIVQSKFVETKYDNCDEGEYFQKMVLL